MQTKTELKEILYNRLCVEEDAKISKSDKVFGFKTEITETVILAKKNYYSIESAIEKKTFLPSLSLKIFRFGGALFFLFVFIGGSYEICMHTPSGYGRLIICIFVLALLAGGTWSLISSILPKHKIEIYAAGLMLGKNRFSWDKIFETYIIRRPGRSEYHQLVLILESQEIIIYPLNVYETLSGEIHIEISAYIEYFRNKYMMNNMM